MDSKSALIALVEALGKRILADLNNGQAWDDLSASNQSIFFDKACQEAGFTLEQLHAFLDIRPDQEREV